VPEVRGEIRIRPARSADVAALVAILLDTFEHTWRPNLTPEAAAAYLEEHRAEDFVAERGREFWVAERAGEVVGLVHWREDFVHALHVRAGSARRGVGAALMDCVEAGIAKAGFAAVRLETDTFNEASQAFYRGRGYREAGRYPDEEWRSGLTTILFVKTLG
jgi:ribosomal protein S18 acetylase RimI-like enzyme